MKRIPLISFLWTPSVFFAVIFFIVAGAVSQIQAQTDVSNAPTNSPSPSSSPPPTLPTQTLNLTVSPITILVETDPGKSVSSSMRVLNNSTEKEYLKIDLATFGSDQGGSNPVIRPFTANEPEQRWLTPTEPSFTVNPGEWRTVSFEFNPPPEAALSYYYALIVTRQNQASESATAVINGAPAVLVLATVNSPNAKQELQLTSFTSKQKVYEFLPAEFEVVVKNTGNIHLGPLGNIFIDAGGKKDLGLLSINQGSGLILPGSERTFSVSWADGFPFYETQAEDDNQTLDAQEKPKRALNWDGKLSSLRFGKFTANLLMVYDNGERDIPVESTLTFWVIPWRFLAAAAIVLLLAIFGIVVVGYLLTRVIKSNEKKR